MAGQIDLVTAGGGGHRLEPGLDRLSSIIRTFNDQFGNITWTDADRGTACSQSRSPRWSQPTGRTATPV